MKNLIEELRNDERGPQDTLVDNNPHYKELQPLQFSNETELLESLSEEQKEKLEKYCDITLEMSPYPNAKHLPRDSESPCGWRALRLRIRQMNNATQSLDSKRIKGLLLSRHTTEFPAFLGFLICVRENAPPSHSKRTQAIPAGVRGGCGTKYDFNTLRLRIDAIISSYTMDFTSIFKGQILYFRGSKIKREKGSASNALPDSQRTAEPTAFPRVLTAFARFFAHIG